MPLLTSYQPFYFKKQLPALVCMLKPMSAIQAGEFLTKNSKWLCIYASAI